MASAEKTSLGLNQWVLADKPTMFDLNEDNRLLDEMLAAKADGDWRVYTSLDELGLTPGEETIDSIVDAMQDRSVLYLSIVSGMNAGLYPVVGGAAMLTVTRGVYVPPNTISRVFVKYETTSVASSVRSFAGTFFYGFQGWRELVTGVDAQGVVNALIYVSTTGDDSSAGTTDAPLATIAAALSMAQQMYNYKKHVVIRFDAGTYYADSLYVANMAKVTFATTSGEKDVTFKKSPGTGTMLTVAGAVSAHFYNITFDCSGDNGTAGRVCLTLDQAASVVLSSCTIIGTAASVFGVYAVSSQCFLFSTIINNCLRAMYCLQGGHTGVDYLSGSGNVYGLTAQQGAIITKGTVTMTSTTPEAKLSGGQILS